MPHIKKVSEECSKTIMIDVNSIQKKVIVIDVKDNKFITFLPNNVEIQ